MRPLPVLPLLLAACASAKSRDFAADFQNCVKVEGIPASLDDHSAFTKCLVDWFGWKIEPADSAVDSVFAVLRRRADSLIQVARDSAARAAAERERELRQWQAESDRFLAIVNSAPIIGDRSRKRYYYTRVECRTLGGVKDRDLVKFTRFAEAESAGYRDAGDPNCGLLPPRE